MNIIDSLIKKKNILDIVDIIDYYFIDRIVDIRRKDYYDVVVTKGDYELSEEGVPITNPDGVANQILSFLIIVNDLKDSLVYIKNWGDPFNSKLVEYVNHKIDVFATFIRLLKDKTTTESLEKFGVIIDDESGEMMLSDKEEIISAKRAELVKEFSKDVKPEEEDFKKLMREFSMLNALEKLNGEAEDHPEEE